MASDEYDVFEILGLNPPKPEEQDAAEPQSVPPGPPHWDESEDADVFAALGLPAAPTNTPPQDEKDPPPKVLSYPKKFRRMVTFERKWAPTERFWKKIERTQAIDPILFREFFDQVMRALRNLAREDKEEFDLFFSYEEEPHEVPHR